MIDEYFKPFQNEIIADDRIIRAFFEFLLTREIKSFYGGPDIPLGAYQVALRDVNEHESEAFLKWLADEESPDVRFLHLPAGDAVTKRYAQFKADDEARVPGELLHRLRLMEGPVTYERNTCGSMSWCRDAFTELQGTSRPMCTYCATFGSQLSMQKTVRRYVIDLDAIRKKNPLPQSDAGPSTSTSAPVPLAASDCVDCPADVQHFLRSIGKDIDVSAIVQGEAGCSANHGDGNGGD
jgi:hypothetical protein